MSYVHKILLNAHLDSALYKMTSISCIIGDLGVIPLLLEELGL